MPKLYISFRELLEDYCAVPDTIDTENHVRTKIRALLNNKEEIKKEPYSQEDSEALRVALIAMQGPGSFYLKTTKELAQRIKKHLLHHVVKAESRFLSVNKESKNKNSPEQNYVQWLGELGLADFSSEKKKVFKQQISVQIQQDAKLYNSFRELLVQYVVDVKKGIIEEENTLGGVVEALLQANPAPRITSKEDGKNLLAALTQATAKIPLKFTRLGERIRTHLLHTVVKEENKLVVQGVQKVDKKKTSAEPKKTPEQHYAKRLKQIGLNDYTGKRKVQKKQEIQNQIAPQGTANKPTTQPAAAAESITVDVKAPFLKLLIHYSQQIRLLENTNENEKKISGVVSNVLARLSTPDFVNDPGKQLKVDWMLILKLELTKAKISLAGSLLEEKIQAYAMNTSDTKSILTNFNLPSVKTTFRTKLEEYCGKTGQITWFRHHNQSVAEVLDAHNEYTTDAALYAALQKKLNPTVEERTAVKSIGGFATTLIGYLTSQNKNKQTTTTVDPETKLTADFNIYKP